MAVESDNNGIESDSLEETRPLCTCPPLSSDTYPSAWLVINHGADKEWNTFFCLSENRYYTRIIPELYERWILTSCYGWWVVINQSRREYLLLQPISMEWIELPPLECKGCNCCILTAAPSDPNCHFLIADVIEKAVIYGRVGEDDFIKQKFEGEYLVAAAQCNGTIYGLMYPDKSVVRITIEGKTLQFSPINIQPTVLPPETVASFEYMLESCGELLLIEKIYSPAFTREVLDIKILKLVSESHWVELNDIGDRAIFLNRNTAISCVAQHQNGGNRVYFTQMGLRIYEFHLLDRSISFSLPCAHKVVINPKDADVRWVLMPPQTQKKYVVMSSN